jgi:CRP-like cAMP-binding protein
VLHRYTQALFTQVAQSAACNRLHTIDQRCARWLLISEDRVGAAQFLLTQEFLAQVLGVRRAGVSEAASRLQQAELIQYRRGIITILDRAGLEAAACEC